jgi:hypothetical protein
MKPPFESYEPQVRRLLEKESEHDRDAALVYILKSVASVGFGGKLPESLAELSQLIGAAIGFCVLLYKREHPEVFLVAADQAKLTDYFLPKFVQTIATLRAASNGMVN